MTVSEHFKAPAKAPGNAVPLHFGPSERWLFGWYHPPASTALMSAPRSAGVVLCNPIGDDFIRSHRTFRHLAERLASIGFAVLRFDFHGTGDSSGDERLPNRVSTWIADIGLAIGELRTRSGASAIGVVGLRLGASLAMVAAAQRGGVESLVLWSPYSSGAAYVAESLRLHKMHKMIEPHSFAGGPSQYADGDEALGFFLTRETCASLAAIDLLTFPMASASSASSSFSELSGSAKSSAFSESLAVPPFSKSSKSSEFSEILAPVAKRALIISTTGAHSEAPLAARLRETRVETDLRYLPGHKFLIATPHNSEVPTPIIDAIAGWLDGAHPPASDLPGLPASADRSPVERCDGEEPIRFGDQGRRFAILGRPSVTLPAERPAILLVSAGCVHRIGPHRLYTNLARRWVRLGFPVLRVDLSGIGDSAAAVGCPENLCYPRDALLDVNEAMALVRDRLGVRRFIIAGLCSGGDIAFRVGLDDRRVVAAVMMNPRTFYVSDPEMVAAYQRARLYQSSFLRPGRWMTAVRGEVDFRRAVRLLLPTVKNVIQPRLQRLIERAHPEGQPAQTDVPGCLRLMAERGVDTLLVVSEHDPGIEFVDERFGDRMRALDGLRGFRRAEIKGTDHTFTSTWAQGHVADLITDHLAARFLA